MSPSATLTTLPEMAEAMAEEFNNKYRKEMKRYAEISFLSFIPEDDIGN